LESERRNVAAASIAVVDAGVDHARALEVCRGLRESRPTLPVAALICCPHSLSLRHLRALADSGVGSLLDLHAAPSDTRNILQSAAKGDLVLHVRLSHGYKALWRHLIAGDDTLGGTSAGEVLSEGNLVLLELLTMGLGDQEMGQRLGLSPHTVKHRIEQLRETLGARNRIALAAWAGKYLMAAPPQEERELEPVGGR
jgi:DNA-binding NarL/FixJ family response regulator